MVYQFDYVSDEFRVKGYMSIPGDIAWDKVSIEAALRGFYEDASLQAEVVAESVVGVEERTDIRTCRMPVLIYCRGGIGKVGAVQKHWIDSFANIGGHIVLAPCYRGNEGGEGRDFFGGVEQEDVDALHRFAASLPFVDAGRISVLGFSRGAVNAARLAASNAKLSGLVLWGGVSDLARTYEERVDLRRMFRRVIGGTPSNRAPDYEARSPAAMAGRISCPTLIIHGTADEQVDYGHGLRMYEELNALGMPVEMHVYEGYGHHLPLKLHETAVRRMFDWLGTSACSSLGAAPQ
ncbi:alpha/beta hydrolase family protein [Cohnella sp. GCM10027633]|uniref:alpha/beta hydrolase family protein n=1 Tax=unclassified Cohnella TaxID=2636738 RepID=UPI0036433FBA